MRLFLVSPPVATVLDERKLGGDKCEARDPNMAELSLARGFTERLRLGTGVQQRKRGLRLGCGAKRVLSSTMSGSTAGTAEEQDFPSPKIWAPAPGRSGTSLGLVLGMPFPYCSLSEVRRLFRGARSTVVDAK
jgi:hypothetical protein